MRVRGDAGRGGLTVSSKDIRRAIKDLLARCSSLELATVSDVGAPCASYAPYVSDAQMVLGIYVSDLAMHTKNFARNPEVSAMIIEDEQSASSPFARQRLVVEGKVRRLERDSDDWKLWLGRFKERYGEIVDTLEQLSDFNLHLVTPVQMTFVRGFGEAYRTSDPDFKKIRHMAKPT